jgi:L-asparagine oxygenase
MTTLVAAPAAELTLDAAAAAGTRLVAGALADPSARIDTPEWVAAARAASADLPAELRRALREFRRDPGASGSLLVRGLPVDPDAMPATPSVDGSVRRVPSLPAAVLMTAAGVLGDPAAFLAEKSGALVQDVVPVPGKEEFQGNAGSVDLSFHNENAFHPHRPDHILLLCVRPDHDRVAGLRTASVRRALPLLGDAARDLLGRPEFVTAAPPSFGSGGDATAPHPVLCGAPDDPDLRVDFAATTPLTARAGAALDELREALEAVATSTRLVPGDLAVVDNRIAVHGRTSFRPRYDGRDRWLLRTFVALDLRRSRSCRPDDGHVLHR